MITRSGALPIVCGCSIYLVMIYTSFASASNDVNSSSMNMTMMKMMERGNIAMGFNQSKIVHQFIATSDGGKIVVTALNNIIF